MNLCNEKHDEVCFEGRICPVCEKMNEIAVLEGDITELKQQVKDLESQVDGG